ncbi:ParE toxin of type II toxin-antitoxin system, parDE [Kordia sp. SMS9]|uniref:type II toxin-antitoxin system RelE/ParE family toxin n=1 Tax=Kordia sp. SMS9 TaxID=2282170 RepID=UPI000E0DCB8E|nr:type II toxin-antitoxin system RelE/ParE family toxin [Kordia sp. SMS9]AXG69607.1 ParE toxin of type II toxin-antitoxin system, parDE [Kordia sp. SMS9]
MVTYKLSNDASQKLEEIYEYSLLNFGADKADEYYLSLHKVFELLSDQPSLGKNFTSFIVMNTAITYFSTKSLTMGF